MVEVSGSVWQLREERVVAIGVHWHWPVDEVEVDICQPQPLQALIQALFRLAMVCTPQLRGHKHIFSLDARVEGLLQALTHLVLVSIYESSINVSVSRLQGVSHRRLDLSWVCNAISSAHIVKFGQSWAAAAATDLIARFPDRLQGSERPY